ncbi:TPA: hypothetical protein IF905_005080 [Escherichia coli]|nr:hypothetical protein [Escherichia coli]
MKAFIDINKSPHNDEKDPEVRLRVKFATGREINITTTCSDLAKVLMGCSEVPVTVSTRNVEVKIK